MRPEIPPNTVDTNKELENQAQYLRSKYDQLKYESNGNGNGIHSPDTLVGYHRHYLHERGFNDEWIEKAGLYTESNPATITNRLNWKRLVDGKRLGACLVIPHYDDSGKGTGYVIYRPDRPRERDGKKIKYESPLGTRQQIYFPPGVNLKSGPLFITEGSLNSLLAVQYGFNCIGLNGVFGAHTKNKTSLHPELERVEWKGKLVYIVFDSDVKTNPNVKYAEAKIAADLEARGSIVKAIRLPELEGLEKTDFDDYLRICGRDKFESDCISVAESIDTSNVDSSYDDAFFLANEFLNTQYSDEDGKLLLHYFVDTWMKYDEKWNKWRLVDDITVMGEVRNFLHARRLKVTLDVSVIKALQKQPVILDSDSKFPCWRSEDASGEIGREEYGINFLNGTLFWDRWIAGKGEDAFISPTPDYICLSSLPFNFNPEAGLEESCPKITAAIMRAMGEDRDKAAVWNEVNSCIKWTPRRPALWLYGPSGGGKGALLALCEAIVGEENVSSIPPQEFGEKFGLEGMIGKLRNISTENSQMTFNGKMRDAYIKTIDSDSMSITRKGKKPWQGHNKAQLFFASNPRPVIFDHYGAAMNRSMIIHVETSIPENERVPAMLSSQWWIDTGEMPAYFNVLVEAQRRYRSAGGKFTKCAAIEKEKEEGRREGNPMEQYIIDNFHYDPERSDGKIGVDVDEVVMMYMNGEGIKDKRNARTIATQLGLVVSRLFPQVEKERYRVIGNGQRRYRYKGMFYGVKEKIEGMGDSNGTESLPVGGSGF